VDDIGSFNVDFWQDSVSERQVQLWRQTTISHSALSAAMMLQGCWNRENRHHETWQRGTR